MEVQTTILWEIIVAKLAPPLVRPVQEMDGINVLLVSLENISCLILATNLALMEVLTT